MALRTLADVENEGHGLVTGQTQLKPASARSRINGTHPYVIVDGYCLLWLKARLIVAVIPKRAILCESPFTV